MSTTATREVTDETIRAASRELWWLYKPEMSTEEVIRLVLRLVGLSA